MTSPPQDRAENRVFTHTLSNIMLLIVFLFLILNIFVTESCKNQYKDNSICHMSAVFTPFRHVIPAIYRPVDLLEAGGNQDRAELVLAAYSFSWGSFLIFGALMIIVAVVRVRLLSDHDRRKYVDWSAQHDRDLHVDKKRADTDALGMSLFLFATAICFIASFWGFFNFDSQSVIGNMVHERDRDLYQPAIFLSMILFFAIVPINRQIKRYLSRTPA